MGTTNLVVCSPRLSQRAGWQINHGEKPATASLQVGITGASLGLPGTEHIFDDGNIERILRGDQFISAIPAHFRQDMLDKNIRRLVKSEQGEATFESIHDVADVIKLAGRGGAFDLESEFGVPSEHLAAFDRVTRLAIGAGIDALRDAGIPLVMRYKTTTKGTQLPDRWGLPDAMRDDTGVIFGSAFPGCDSFADIMGSYYKDHERREQLALLEGLRARATGNGHSDLGQELDQRIGELRAGNRKTAVCLRPALPAQSLVDGTFAIRRTHRRARSQHANQLRMRDHRPRRFAGAGLDPRRTVPPRHRHLGRRCHLRQPDRLDGRRFSGQRSSRHR